MDVALKELKHVPGEEMDWDVERAWKQEIDALKEISELEDDHLISPIAAFKWGQSKYYQDSSYNRFKQLPETRHSAAVLIL